MSAPQALPSVAQSEGSDLICGSLGYITEGIIYLTMDNNQFYATYVANKKGWF